MTDQLNPDHDPTEALRRVHQILINEGIIQPGEQTWTTDRLREDFDVLGFMAPYVVVRRKADGVKGSLAFRHAPRLYFGWKADEK